MKIQPGPRLIGRKKHNEKLMCAKVARFIAGECFFRINTSQATDMHTYPANLPAFSWWECLIAQALSSLLKMARKVTNQNWCRFLGGCHSARPACWEQKGIHWLVHDWQPNCHRPHATTPSG